MSQNQNGISSRFSSQNSSQFFFIELPPRDVHERYIRFPSISVCFDLDTEKKLEFRQFRPWNETFISLDFRRHQKNGCLIPSGAASCGKGFVKCFPENSTHRWALLQLPYCPSKQAPGNFEKIFCTSE